MKYAGFTIELNPYNSLLGIHYVDGHDTETEDRVITFSLGLGIGTITWWWLDKNMFNV